MKTGVRLFLGFLLVVILLFSFGFVNALPNGGNMHCNSAFGSGINECRLGAYGSNIYTSNSVGCFDAGVCGTHYYVGYVDHSGGDYLCYNGNSCGGGGCTDSCLSASSVICGGSLANGCASGCSATGGTKCNGEFTCVSAVCVPNLIVNKTYWANMRGQVINQTNIGNLVQMKVPGTNISNRDVNYSIKKQNSYFFGLIKTSSSIETSLTSALWFAGRKADGTNDSGAGFYFTAQIGNFTNQSEGLDISPLVNNSFPVAIITAPVIGYNASVGNLISFNHVSYDSDDLLNVTWNFGDGQTSSVVNYSIALTSGFGDSAHSYSTPGTYTVTLNVTEMTRGQSSIDTRTIQVFQSGLTLFPGITPVNGQAFVGLIASFNASSSSVMNCTTGLISPLSFSTNDGKLNCSYLHSAGQRITNGYNLITNWTIQGQNEVYGNWSNLSNVEFSKLYFQGGTYLVSFKLKYVSGLNVLEANKTVSFSIDGGWSCNSTSTIAFWQRGAYRLNATNNCTAYNSSSVGSCCPSGYSCDGINCVNNVVRNYCSDFTTQASCLGVNRNSTIARNSVPNITVCNKPASTFNNGSVTCYNQTSCICTWQNNSCTSGLGATTSCPNQPPIVFPPTCFWTYTVEDNCNTTSTRTLRATPNILFAGCESSSQTLACVQTAKLDFITNLSLAIIVLLIILVYVYLVLKRKNLVKNNSNKKKASSRKIYK